MIAILFTNILLPSLSPGPSPLGNYADPIRSTSAVDIAAALVVYTKDLGSLVNA